MSRLLVSLLMSWLFSISLFGEEIPVQTPPSSTESAAVVTSAPEVEAESGAAFKDLRRFQVAYLKFILKTVSVDPSTDDSYGGWTLNFAWASNGSKLWDTRFRWEQNLFSDAVAGVINKEVQKKEFTDSGLDHAFSSGLFGSFQYYINVMAQDRLLISPGISFGDYVVAVHQFTDRTDLPTTNNGRAYFDPAGYYAVVGPSLMVSYIPLGKFWIDGYINYEIAVSRVGGDPEINYVRTEGYALPHFLTLGAEVYHNDYPFYGGFRLNKLQDKGENGLTSQRTDLYFGMYWGG